MTSYLLAIYALLIGLLLHSYLVFFSLDMLWRQALPRRQKYLWLALAAASALLALQQGNWLELALRTSLHDASQSLLSALAAVFFCCIAWLIRPVPDTPPPQ